MAATVTPITSTGSPRSVNPAKDLTDYLKGTGRAAYIERNRRHLMAMADAYRHAATIERAAIKKSGKRWLGGADVAYKAWKITRPLEHAADYAIECARSLRLSHEYYLGAFAEAARNQAKAGAFDPTK